jgi:hypothetical protein
MGVFSIMCTCTSQIVIMYVCVFLDMYQPLCQQAICSVHFLTIIWVKSYKLVDKTKRFGLMGVWSLLLFLWLVPGLGLQRWLLFGPNSKWTEYSVCERNVLCIFVLDFVLFSQQSNFLVLIILWVVYGQYFSFLFFFFIFNYNNCCMTMLCAAVLDMFWACRRCGAQNPANVSGCERPPLQQGDPLLN